MREAIGSITYFVVILLMSLILTVTLVTYLWLVVLMAAALGIWTLIPAILFPAGCIWAAYKVAQ
jgi:hypothetical protein